MDYFEQIDDYINDVLTEGDRAAFEKAMLEDPKLRQAVGDHGAAMDVVGSILEAEVRKVIDEEQLKIDKGELIIDDTTIQENGDEGDTVGREKGAKVKRMDWMRWAAAAVVVFVLGWWGVNQMGVDNEQLFSQVYSDPSWPSERGDEETELSKSIVGYLTGDKKQAILSLKQMPESESKYWLAEIYLKEMKYDSALIYLPKETLHENKNRRDRINYIHILSLYFGNAKDQSRAAISKLPEDTDAYYTQIYSELSF